MQVRPNTARLKLEQQNPSPPPPPPHDSQITWQQEAFAGVRSQPWLAIGILAWLVNEFKLAGNCPIADGERLHLKLHVLRILEQKLEGGRRETHTMKLSVRRS